MKFALKTGMLLAFTLVMGGCVYDPGYSYVRGDGYYGDAYYGTGYDNRPAYYNFGYGYGYGYGYWPGYYGYHGPTFGRGFRYDNRSHSRHNGPGPIYPHGRRR